MKLNLFLPLFAVVLARAAAPAAPSAVSWIARWVVS